MERRVGRLISLLDEILSGFWGRAEAASLRGRIIRPEGAKLPIYFRKMTIHNFS